METLKLPAREIQERYTRSEIAVMAWASQESHHRMMKRLNDARSGAPAQGREQKQRDLPDRYYNKDGELDLSQLDGEEAHRYLQNLGFNL